MTDSAKDTVRFKEFDGEIYLHAEDLQKSFKTFFYGVVKDLHNARAYDAARKAEVIADAVVGRIVAFRTSALTKTVKKNDFDRKVTEIVNNFFFGGK